MSNTVITNYTDLNGPSTKADSSVVVIVNKDGSLSVDQKLLGTLMGTDGSQSAGISVVRVGHEGKPDDATDSETDDDKVPHVTLSVDSYYDEPNSIIKYDSGAEMLQSLRIETRENSLVGFQNDHCYTPLRSPSQASVPQQNENFSPYDESVIEITHTPPPKPVPSSKKITILEQQIIPKGKKIVVKPTETPVISKGNDVLNKPISVTKSKEAREEKSLEGLQKSDESSESSSISSSGDSIPDRDSDSDYKDTKDRTGSLRLKKNKLKPRILKSVPTKPKTDPKIISRLKPGRNILKKEKDKTQQKQYAAETKDDELDLESILPSSKISTSVTPGNDLNKTVFKQTPKPVKKEKKTPAHVTALLSDMTSLFSTPDVIRRVSTDTKLPLKTEKESPPIDKKSVCVPNVDDHKLLDTKTDNTERSKNATHKTYVKLKEKVVNPLDKSTKPYDPMPQLDDASLAQILQDTTGITTNSVKSQPTMSTANTMSSPGLAGPLSPTLDLLGGLQPEEEGLTEDFLMSVAQLVESSENLQEVIDKQVLGKVDSPTIKTPVQQHTPASNLYTQTLAKSVQKNIPIRKDPIEIVRRDGRVITLPPIEAPATRSSKRKTQMETASNEPPQVVIPVQQPVATTPEPQVQAVSKQYTNKKFANKKESLLQTPDKISAESQESWNSEDDPNRLWCICKQPHNNRFMICCDGCEDWFHGKCVNITKAMGQQMEEQGIEWRCPNCIKKAKPTPKTHSKVVVMQNKTDSEAPMREVKSPVLPGGGKDSSSKTSCIVCKKPARVSSIYCSNSCIWKHAQDSLGNQGSPTKGDNESGKSEKPKPESRVIVYERKSGRLLAGPNAPTAENLKSWLQSNPTFEVVRPGTLSTIKPTATKRKSVTESNKIQMTLNFERIPRKSAEQFTPKASTSQQEVKERTTKLIPLPKQEIKPLQLKSPVSTKSQMLITDTPKASTSTARPMTEPRKLVRATTSRSQSMHDKAPSVSPSTPRRKDTTDGKNKMAGSEPIRDNVRKSLQEQMSIRMAENSGTKFTEEDIQEFANDTENELHELFRDVGMKYKAKYRSLMFNIKDRKNLTLWEKICDREITPKQLVRLSPEELASQELAQWRDKEAKHQLELIKKSELDLMAASKTYVLKTHKGEEVMETKESVSTELDPNVPVEDVVTALNDETVGPDALKESSPDNTKKAAGDKKHNSKKRSREDSSSSRSKRKRRDSKRDTDKKSRSSRRKSEVKERDSRNEHRRSMRRSEKKSSRLRSPSKDRSKLDNKESGERPQPRSSSREKSRRLSKSENARSKSQGRERSRSPARSRRRSQSRDGSHRRRSRSKHRLSSDDAPKNRSRSQENTYTKSKIDSTDSDSVERPKSATLKEVHPEYDPHEPMITSALSEEDLRKSSENVFEENYDNEIGKYGVEYDPSKTLIDTSEILPVTTFSRKPDKTSEAESDQEPSSTVENSVATVWSGCINMVDVARFYVAAYEVSGSPTDLEEDLTTELDIVGRINPDTVWDYIVKMKKTSNKDIVILKLQTANDEEKMQYIALYSYLSSRNRLGVIKTSNMMTVKDFYIVPLPANKALPPVLLPLDGPGLGEVKTHLLIGILIRKKRTAPNIPIDTIPAKVARESRKRSYTPPASPRRRAALPLPAYTSQALSTSVKDKIAASLVSADDEEAYSPGSSSSSASASASAAGPGLAGNTLKNKMEELNRQIEEQKQQIRKMAQADSSVGEEDEAYSPSRPMTPPSVSAVPLADIALPSNLQEILATIKQRSETNAADVDMRNLPLP